MAYSLFELSRFLARKVGLYRFQCGPMVFRLTSASRDLIIGGNLYVSAPGISHSPLRQSGSSDQKNQPTITMPYLLTGSADEYPVTQVLGNLWRPFPPSERVQVLVMTTHIGDPDEEIHIDWGGRVVGPSFDGKELALRCDPSWRNPRTAGPIPRMQRNCGVPLYSQGLGLCNLNPERIAVPATVLSIDGDEVTIEIAGEPPRPLAPGPIEWLDGGEPVAAEVVGIAGSVLTLDDASGLAAEQEVTIYTEPLWFDAELTDVDGVILTSPAFATSDKPLAGGFVKWVRLDGRTEWRSIMSHVGSEIRIHYGGADLLVGTVVRTYAGCAHNLSACTDHGNEVNYPGFKHLPVEDPMPRSQAW